MQSIETSILKSLVLDNNYMIQAMPYLTKDHFQSVAHKNMFRAINGFTAKYQKQPTLDVLDIVSDKFKNLSEEEYTDCKSIITEIREHQGELPDTDWLVGETETYVRDVMLMDAVYTAIDVGKGDNKDIDRGELPELFRDAVSVSFNSDLGHDYFEDAAARYDYYHAEENRIAFDIDLLNKITGGGVPIKTLNIIMAGTNVGKSMLMCHLAAAAMLAGKNVVYITCEMAEEKISERIDANVLQLDLDTIKHVKKEQYLKRLKMVGEKCNGRLKVQEYPTSSANANHFRHYLNELKLKDGFVPDVIMIDYLNICASSRYTNLSNVNSYSYVKAIAEELRALAVEFEVPIWSATQTTRGGINNTDIELSDTSESIGLPATADLMLGMMTSEELEKSNLFLFKQLKNRYSNPAFYRKFVVGVNKAQMKFYDAPDSEQGLVSNEPSDMAATASAEDKHKHITDNEIDFG